MVRGIYRQLNEVFATIRDYLAWKTAPLRNDKKKALRYSALLLLVLFSLAVLFAKLNSSHYANQVQQTRTNLQQLQDQIGSILPPNKIELGQQDLSVDYILDQTDPDTFSPQKIQKPSTLFMPLNLLPKVSYPYSAFGLLDDVRTDTADLVRYHREVIVAIESVLEYNPKADLSDKTLNDQEIKLRIDNARVGLTKASESLENVSSQTIDDPSKGKILKSIANLQRSLNTFESSKDKAAWYDAVEVEQQNIVKNRQDFWNKETNKLYADISELNQDLSVIETDLRN